MRIFCPALAFALAACAPTIQGANERGGVMTHVIGLTMDDAFSKADAHCRNYGRIAKVTATDPWNSTLTFECVPP